MEVKVCLIVLFLAAALKSSSTFSFIRENTGSFTFPEDGGGPENPVQQVPDEALNEILTRQAAVPPAAAPNSSVSTCICVAVGQCPTGTFDGSGQIDIRIVNNPPTTTTAPTVSTTCRYGLVRCCLLGAYRCGIRYPPVPGSRAPAAGQAPFGAYPWQAAILTTADVYLGSGALVDRNHILTAAHKINNLATNTYKIRLGEWDAAALTEPIPAQDFTVSRAVIHPNFNPTNLQNDVAVLRLSTDVALGEVPTIATACLPTTSFVGQRCYVAGWGKNDFNGAYQAIQKEVDVLVQTQQYCQTTLAGTRLGVNFQFNNASFMCAGGEVGKDACTGDGGSPLMCLLNGQWYAVGLVAWGIGCAQGGVPGVYVNLSTFLSWIQTTVTTT